MSAQTPQWIDYPFDVECYPNIFTAVFVHADSGTRWIFEVSERRNQSAQFLMFVRLLGTFGQVRMVGYNNIGYDYPLIHHLCRFHSGFTAQDAYQKSAQLIATKWDDRFKNVIRDNQCIVKQVDLLKVHHFDNKARLTSLKQIEIALRMPFVQDLPFKAGEPVPFEGFDDLISYNCHDVDATGLFYRHSRKQLEFRDVISLELGSDCTNKSDSNIGSEIFIKELEDHTPGITGTRVGKKRQTFRSEINLANVVFPYVQFQHPEFQRIHQHFLTTTITETKGVFDKLVADCYGLKFAFGTGGIHGAKENRTWVATPERIVQGRDVSSYYPNLAIKNRVYPEHLSDVFCDIYERLYKRRKSFPKSDPRNGALKLALNGTYGNSNSVYSCFYDPQYTMTITINGQLLLCMLAEWLAQVPTLELIQVNTDGVEYAVDAIYEPQCDAIAEQWEKLTMLSLDTENYKIFAQRDVNNYLCVDDKGKIKCKGAFEYQHGLDSDGYEEIGDGLNWHKNQSSKIIAMAAEAKIVHGVPIPITVNQCDDPYLFMQTLKLQRNDRAMWGGEIIPYEDLQSPADVKTGKHPKRNRHVGGKQEQKTGRFYISNHGQPLFKVMPPLKKLPHHERPQAIEKGFRTTMCNDLHHFDWADLNRSYYIEKAIELVENTGFYHANQ